MKLCLLSLLLIPLIIQAAPYHRYYRTHRTPSKIAAQIEAVNKLNWKPVVAGGVAGGTLIAAYKISDGIQFTRQYRLRLNRLSSPSKIKFCNIIFDITGFDNILPYQEDEQCGKF